MHVEMRPPTRDDLAEVVDLYNRAHVADQIPEVVALDEMDEELADKDWERDLRVAVSGGRIVGVLYTHFLPSETGEERAYLFGEVDPPYRRRGIGRELIAFGIERATEQLRSTGRCLPKVIRIDVDDTIPDAARLVQRLGLKPIRYHEHLIRPLDEVPEPWTPEGVTIVGWPDDRDDEILAEKNESFADHWGTTPSTPQRWRDAVRGFGARSDLSFIAVDGDDRVVAHCLSKRYEADDEITGRVEAWIDNLGTLRAWRGRGVGSALIAHALRAFADAGMDHALLSVDSANPTGAARLYRSLGFTRHAGSTTFQLDV